MQNFRNYYDILGVSKDATIEDIKRSFRRLAREFHPDMNPGNKAAEEKFKDINEAYEVLSDSNKRAQYEHYAQYWKQKGFQSATRSNVWGGNVRNAGTDDFNFSEFADFNTFVDQVLNNRTNHRTNHRSANVRANPAPATGSKPTARSPKNSYIPGSHKTSRTVSSPPPTRPRDAEARLTIPLEKAYLGGRERIRLEDGRSLEVNMPAGMFTGQLIRLQGQGVAGGNLYLKIDVAPHPFFKLEDNAIFCQLPVTPSEAVLGGAVEVPTLDGPVKMNLPPGVRSGQRLRLANKGYPTAEGDRGDQIVEIQIVVPKDLTDEEQELYQKLRQIETFNPRADLI
jgi:curved DNA-binding protein